LNIAKRGWVNLAMGEYDNFLEAEYYMTTDDRLRFKLSWRSFVQEFGLNVGVIVLILFHMEWSGYMKVASHCCLLVILGRSQVTSIYVWSSSGC
jgi:hypothetical protein